MPLPHRLSHPSPSPFHGPPAFTLIELLTALAVTALLLALLLPGLAAVRSKAAAVACLSSFRQLHQAWTLHADEHDGRLPGNHHGPPIRESTAAGNWVGGWLDWTASPHNTNLAFLTQPRWSGLAPYLAGSAPLFRCPSDRARSAANPGPRARSVSMNAALGEGNDKNRAPGSPRTRVCLTAQEVPDPAATWVFIDEHADSINDGCFFVDPDQPRWLDLPASRHRGGASLVFADGHARIQRWLAAETRRPVRKIEGDYHAFAAADPRDIRWLQAHTPLELSP